MTPNSITAATIHASTDLPAATAIRFARCTPGHDEATLHRSPGPRAWSATALSHTLFSQARRLALHAVEQFATLSKE